MKQLLMKWRRKTSKNKEEKDRSISKGKRAQSKIRNWSRHEVPASVGREGGASVGGGGQREASGGV